MDNEQITTDNMQEPSSENKPTQLTGIGARLKSAREAMHLTEKDAAGRLHLSVRFIYLMENEDFASGPPFTFMRGYLRSYARILNIPTKEVDIAIETLGMNPPEKLNSAPTLAWEPAGNGFNFDPYVRWISYLIFFTLIVLVGVWWNARSPENEVATKTSHPTSPQVNSNPVPVAAQPPAAAAPQTMAPTATSTPAAQQTIMPAAGQPVPSAGQLQAAPQPVQPSNGQLQQPQSVSTPAPQPMQPTTGQLPVAQPVQTTVPVQGQVPAAPPAPMQPAPQAVAPTNPAPSSTIPAYLQNPQNVPNPPNQPNVPNVPNAPNPGGTMLPSTGMPTIEGQPGLIGPTAPVTIEEDQSEGEHRHHRKHRRHRHVHMRMVVPEPGLYQ